MYRTCSENSFFNHNTSSITERMNKKESRGDVCDTCIKKKEASSEQPLSPSFILQVKTNWSCDSDYSEGLPDLISISSLSRQSPSSCSSDEIEVFVSSTPPLDKDVSLSKDVNREALFVSLATSLCSWIRPEQGICSQGLSYYNPVDTLCSDNSSHPEAVSSIFKSHGEIKTETLSQKFCYMYKNGIVSYMRKNSRQSKEQVFSAEEFYASQWKGLLPLAPMPIVKNECIIQNRRTNRRKSAISRCPDSHFPLDLTLKQNKETKLVGTGTDISESFIPTEELKNTSSNSYVYKNEAVPTEGATVASNSSDKPGSSGASAVSGSAMVRPGVRQSLSVPSGTTNLIGATNETRESLRQPVAGGYGSTLPLVGSPPSAMKELPGLRDAAPNKREELFIKKLQLCGVIFSFDDPTSDKRGKDMKRQTLLELVDYVNTPAGQKIFTESVMGDLMACVSANVCRALPPATDDFDPEEDEPVLEPAWPHLQVAYEFFLRFIVSSEVNAKAAKKYVDQRFCLQLVELFDSEDPRERDYLKTILHRIYGKFMSHRSFIRRAISNVFYRFVYETERHNGIGELLEILGSIINGFAIPLKKEHLQFLVRALIPLHKPKCVGLYHQQLSYCIIQYVEKDADTATPILNGFFKCWPWSCSGKQVLFLNELEEILELLGTDQLEQISKTLFTNLARCLDSDHFQVVERALFLWNNEHLVNSGCLSRLNAQTVLPIIYGPLYKNSSGHWNATVEGLAQNVLKMYMEYDLVLYDKCTSAFFKEEEEAKQKIEAISKRWAQIEEMAQTNARDRLITAS